VPALTLALSALLAAPPAASDPPGDQAKDRVRYQRQSTSAPRAREDALERRLERAKQTRAREAEEIFRGLGHQFRICRACVEREMRLKQIEFLINLLETVSEDDPEYPYYLFRLADHYLEEKAHHELQAASLHEKIDGLEFEIEALDSEAAPKSESSRR
jgi:hypothetical protein